MLLQCRVFDKVLAVIGIGLLHMQCTLCTHREETYLILYETSIVLECCFFFFCGLKQTKWGGEKKASFYHVRIKGLEMIYKLQYHSTNSLLLIPADRLQRKDLGLKWFASWHVDEPPEQTLHKRLVVVGGVQSVSFLIKTKITEQSFKWIISWFWYMWLEIEQGIQTKSIPWESNFTDDRSVSIIYNKTVTGKRVVSDCVSERFFFICF